MEILYSDKDIVVCIKPVGIDSESQLPAALKETLGGEIFTLHRLDLNVGGVMVYARTKSMAAALSRVIQDGAMIKEYAAMVHGVPPEAGDWEDLLWKDAKKNKVFVVNRERKGVKKARLTFQRLRVDETADEKGASEKHSLVHIRLYTGRSHQIRVQFSSRNFPLVGDHKYGSRARETEPMLFSCRITFPYKGEHRSFEALPEWAKTNE
ncbi:MAG: RluA family pseudouridine synthase [Peptococcaceae bacterium]|nr:RluA family pseudouridine synthase [Peptococcaceae bacterium]